MVQISVSVHPNGLCPTSCAKAWFLRTQKWSWKRIANQLKNLKGQRPSFKAVRNAAARQRVAGPKAIAHTRYKNCGRKYGANGHKYKLSKQQSKQLVAFVKKWRRKRFCTCAYVRKELKLEVSLATMRRALNRAGFHWKPVSKSTSLSAKDLLHREAFVRQYENKSPDWWVQNVSLVFDGVTLTRAPATLSGQQKHAAQSIGFMWMRKGEKWDPALATANRYGVQFGTKMPLWGGFSGSSGHFSLKLRTARPKLTKEEWKQYVPSIAKAAGASPGQRLKIWHDNERFLQIPVSYRDAGLKSIRFPTNSGDLNPIETVWARLRKDMAMREMQDISKGKPSLSAHQFKARAAQLLHSYSVIGPGKKHNYYQELLRGMPARLCKCRCNKFGRCGK